jgi:pyruvate dehydrogenase E2 component (dihydrolipoamide acetyltransferase)
MPRQGNTVESCIIVDWKVKEGDSVSADTSICEVETDKAAIEVPAGEAGIVLKLLRAAGDDVPVLEPIAVIGRAGEDWAAALGGQSASAASGASNASGTSSTAGASGAADSPAADRAVPAPVPAAPAASIGAPPGAAFISPRARNLAAKEGLSVEGVAGSGPGGRIIERDIVSALGSRPPLTAAAKAAAAGGSVPAAGSGLGGRVTAADLAGPSAAGVPAGADEGAVTETPIKGIRKLIADRMFRSLAESAQFTLNGGASASRMQDLRSRMKEAGEESGLSKITVNDFILFAVSRVLPRYPFMNALKIADAGGGAVLRTFERVHLGVAVDTPKGLMVPVIRNANLLSLRQISSEAKRLAAACQGGGIQPDELSGSTFTVTNLGSFGVTGFTPVLNAPEVAILGVCGIELKPSAGKDGEIRFEPRIGFSLTINHEVVDGAPAARFLKALGDAVADIDLWLTQ